MRKYIAEFLGTFMLVFFGTGSVVYSAITTQSPITIGLSFGLALAVAIYAFGHISGGHFNPAVSLSMAIQKRLSWVEFVGYVLAQLIGAIVASGAVYLGVTAYLKSTSVTTALSGQSMTVKQFVTLAGLGQTNFADGQGWYAFAFELILTFLFVLVISIVTKLANVPAPLIIGLWLAVLIIVALPITGGAFNPARALGPAIFVQGKALGHVWVYLVADLLGGALAAFAANFFNKGITKEA
ncbi:MULTISPECIES: MIP/aquaporin family protein [Leuconostoc]|uniref:Aquaporin n=1 Tax=Leuconostoc pseudomesenteroides TaxID=33968 RepID=A0A5B8T305_LEUPS|nr:MULTISPECIES: aquaporin [Leuconostoc]MCC8440845.1 glycerol transporter [Leuconostoc pseudomesenteroides]MCT4386670.1 glycerol transporter [Leuconostoc pseudomesenteroides]MDG9733697.1 aquaporin [Leuconostoc pseudomesenteroides]MDN2450761.1 glycerol transporter [Leuconostoc sp. UCMA20149]NKZ36199.1 glycerol transporter [Leuconostoc pseudomesenteroides]